ncbi:MAG TPA: DNA repair protein RecO [Clostridia bacterium]|nr:DNA repair protein RecO [Clostridia bacterium]
MRQIELEGVVLQRNKINDRDCYLRVFTRQMGKVDIFARGANHPKNALNIGSSPFCYGLYQVSGRKLQLRSVEVIDSFYDLRNDFSIMLMASFFTKSYLYLFQEKQVSVEAFELIINSLSVLKKFPALKDKMLAYFLARIIKIMGLMPDLDCVKRSTNGYMLQVEMGEAQEGGEDTEALLLWRDASNMKMSAFLNLSLDSKDLEKAARLMEGFIYAHLGADLPTLHQEMSEYL